MKRKKMLGVVSLFLLCLLGIVLYILNYPHTISPPGTLLTEKRLLKDLKYVTSTDTRVKDVHISSIIILQALLENSAEEMDMEDLGIVITSSNKKVGRITKPYEVIQAMQTWFYLKDRKLPYNIGFVYSGFDRKWAIDDHPSIYVLKPEFDRLYAQVDPSLGEEEVIRLLVDAWIQENNYEQWWHTDE